ncbi:MAG TPA: glucose 1-dehydrogenase [Longimicrobiaceae bacterium]
MRAVAAIPATREVAVVEHPEPALATPTSVLVRTLEVGVCGTDAELCAFHFGYPPASDDYLVLGHEAAGIVERVGDEVTSLTPGDLVVPSVRRPCPRADCAACRSGSQDFCLTGEYTERGINGAHGFLVDRFVEEERFLYRLPAALRGVAVLTEPLSIAEKGLRQYLAIQRRLPWLQTAEEAAMLAGRRAVVLGAGAVGMLGAMLLRQRDCEVWVYSREEAASPRAALIEAIGAHYRSSADLPVAQLAEEVGGIELVYEAAGAPGLSLAVLETMGRSGVFIVTGATGGGGRLDIGADALLNSMVVGNLVLAGTVNASHADFVSAVNDLEAFVDRWPDVVPRLITGRHPRERFHDRVLHRTGIKEIIDLAMV